MVGAEYLTCWPYRLPNVASDGAAVFCALRPMVWVCYDTHTMSEVPAVAPIIAVPTGAQELLRVRYLGRISYDDALDEQRRLYAARLDGSEPDTLLLLEHPHIFTLGRNSDATNILYDEAFLRAQGAGVVRVERGGEVTYHGPGQLVAYPVIRLRPEERSLSALVGGVEEAIIRTLQDFGIAARRDPSDRGVWAGARKIASVGMSVRRWVVQHGMALNVDPDLRYFDFINPCGHAGLAMTSIRRELGSAPDLERVGAAFARHFAAQFARVLCE